MLASVFLEYILDSNISDKELAEYANDFIAFCKNHGYEEELRELLILCKRLNIAITDYEV